MNTYTNIFHSFVKVLRCHSANLLCSNLSIISYMIIWSVWFVSWFDYSSVWFPQLKVFFFCRNIFLLFLLAQSYTYKKKKTKTKKTPNYIQFDIKGFWFNIIKHVCILQVTNNLMQFFNCPPGRALTPPTRWTDHHRYLFSPPPVFPLFLFPWRGYSPLFCLIRRRTQCETVVAL